ncbi:hypothetical protein NBRC116493_02510 [Aurantivibrio infirmus]
MTETDFLQELRRLCSDIEKPWLEHLEFWEGDEPGIFNEISVIVHYVINKLEAKDTVEFQPVFDLVERGVNSKNRNVSELAVTGFLEGILFVGSHKDLRPELFECWLGPSSIKAIEDLEIFFSNGT